MAIYKRRLKVAHIHIPAARQARLDLSKFFAEMFNKLILSRLEPFIVDVDVKNKQLKPFKDDRPSEIPPQSEFDCRIFA